MRLPITTYAIIGLFATAGLQLGRTLLFESATTPEGYVGAERGSRLTIKVTTAGGGTMQLSDVAAGSCRYVAILSPTCNASIAAAAAWRQALAADSSTPEVPADWHVVWVVAGDSIAARRAFGSNTPHPLSVPVSPAALLDAAQIRAFPAHLILNRAGEVVDGNVGVRLMAPAAYRPDCTIVDTVAGV